MKKSTKTQQRKENKINNNVNSDLGKRREPKVAYAASSDRSKLQSEKADTNFVEGAFQRFAMYAAKVDAQNAVLVCGLNINQAQLLQFPNDRGAKLMIGAYIGQPDDIRGKHV